MPNSRYLVYRSQNPREVYKLCQNTTFITCCFGSQILYRNMYRELKYCMTYRAGSAYASAGDWSQMGIAGDWSFLTGKSL